jgi:hypothetical protein
MPLDPELAVGAVDWVPEVIAAAGTKLLTKLDGEPPVCVPFELERPSSLSARATAFKFAPLAEGVVGEKVGCVALAFPAEMYVKGSELPACCGATDAAATGTSAGSAEVSIAAAGEGIVTAGVATAGVVTDAAEMAPEATGLTSADASGVISVVPLGLLTVTVNVVDEEFPKGSETVVVIVAVPVWLAAGVMVRVRFPPSPTELMAESGTSPVFDELLLTDSVETESSGSETLNGSGGIVPPSSMA